MEARLVDALPTGPEWSYEPKWDGFRCLAYRRGDAVALRSKSGKPLDRFFPEVAEMLRAARGGDFALDGELMIASGEAVSFAALQARLHPAESRIRRLSVETPARLMLFDVLALGEKDLMDAPLADRRPSLARFHRAAAAEGLDLSPATRDIDEARAWLDRAGHALDGVVAKRLDLPYRPGERVMAKVKRLRTADCVVGGFRYAGHTERAIGSLLLGLHDDAGRLHHVGHTSSISAAEKVALLARLKPLIGGTGFTGDAPGGKSRWANARSDAWQPLRPELVVEVRYDQVTGCRFRHGTRLLRWRPDKDPARCTLDQLARELRPAELAELIGR